MAKDPTSEVAKDWGSTLIRREMASATCALSVRDVYKRQLQQRPAIGQIRRVLALRIGILPDVDDRIEAQAIDMEAVSYTHLPLYHLNLDEWAKRKDVITAHYAVFSPLHREIALLPMSDFRYLSDDHLVQQTLFGQTVEVIANFGDQAFARADLQVPGHALVAHWLGTSRLSRIPQP